jgi:hypothetical protein
MSTRAEILRSQLVEIGDGIAGHCQHLHRDPTPDACETLSIRLQGAARHLMHLAAELKQPGSTEAPRRTC